MATTDLKTNSTVTMQVPLYDPAGSGEAAYGRYALSDLLANAFDGITAESILTALVATFPTLTITIGGANPPSQTVIDTLVGYGFLEGNILFAQTSAQPTLVVANMASASSLGSVSLVQASGDLVVSGLSSASSLGTVTLTLQGEEGGTLTVAGLSSASSLASVTLVQASGELIVANLSSASSLGTVTITEQASGNSFSDDFSGTLGDAGKFATLSGSPIITAGDTLFLDATGYLSAAVDMTRGFKLSASIQLPNGIPDEVPAVGIESFDYHFIVNSANSVSSGNRYEVVILYRYDDETPESYADVLIYDNGTEISSANYFTPTTNAWQVTVEFQAGGNIVVKADEGGSAPTTTRATVSDSTHSSFSYLIVGAKNIANGITGIIDNVTITDL